MSKNRLKAANSSVITLTPVLSTLQFVYHLAGPHTHTNAHNHAHTLHMLADCKAEALPTENVNCEVLKRENGRRARLSILHTLPRIPLRWRDGHSSLILLVLRVTSPVLNKHECWCQQQVLKQKVVVVMNDHQFIRKSKRGSRGWSWAAWYMALPDLNEIYEIKFRISAESGVIQRHTGL